MEKRIIHSRPWAEAASHHPNQIVSYSHRHQEIPLWNLSRSGFALLERNIWTAPAFQGSVTGRQLEDSVCEPELSKPARKGDVLIHKGSAGSMVREGRIGSIGTVSTVASQWDKCGDDPPSGNPFLPEKITPGFCPFPLHLFSLFPLPQPSRLPELLYSPLLTI